VVETGEESRAERSRKSVNVGVNYGYFVPFVEILGS
jgi:hypothetical protein